jgi:DNA primase, catalytic core
MSIISEVKQRVDIVELVSEYVTLQKAGRNFKGLCPFHSEKHPSFFVFPEQQTWHCFGACGSGGDIFSFIMKKEGVDFGQALRLLAQRAGITLSSPGLPDKGKDEGKERLFQLNEAAAQYYHHLLLNTKVGEVARSYLAKRKVTLETIKEFRLGFSPASWEAIKEYLTSKDYKEKELVETGLVIEKEGGNSYDRFRNRLMFPICDIQGRVTGFGARALDDSLPKYINSPQTSIFDKGGSLYGIDKAVSAIRKKNMVIIVEGYMDVLLPHQHGWQNVVASMGTSMTEKQVDIAKRLSKNIALALDADAAGEEATLRAEEVLTHFLDKKTVPIPLSSGRVKYESVLDAEIKVIALPQGKDPDEVVSENPTLWQNLVEQAIPVLDFAFDSVLSRSDMNKVKDKSRAIQKLSPLIYEIKDPLQRSHYVSKLARELKIEESDAKAALRELKTNQKRQQLSKSTDQSRFTHQLVSSPIEEYCLALLLQYPELRQSAQELSTEHFDCTENREVFVKWQCSPDISALRNELDANLLEHLNYLLNKTFPPTIRENGQERYLASSDCILRLQERLSRKLEVARELMFNLTREKEGINAELAELEREGISSSHQLKEIFAAKVQKRSRGIK